MRGDGWMGGDATCRVFKVRCDALFTFYPLPSTLCGPFTEEYL